MALLLKSKVIGEFRIKETPLIKLFSSVNRSSLCGTMDYLCPEILKKEAYDQKVDVWCLGVLLYEICVGSTPFYAKEPKEKLQNILQMNIKFPKDLSEDFRDLVISILKENPKRRPDVSEIFEHRWMKKFYKIYSIDENNLDLSLSPLTQGNRIAELNEDCKKSLILRESCLTNEYLEKYELGALIETKPQKHSESPNSLFSK